MSSSSSHRYVPSSFSVHASFRDSNNCKLKPNGLEWNLPGLSEVVYVPYPPLDADNDTGARIDVNSSQVIRGIVEAHNRWSFAKDLPFVREDDIASLSTITGRDKREQFVTVSWKPNEPRRERVERHFGSLKKMLEHDAASKFDTKEESDPNNPENTPPEVWINGKYISTLSGADSLPPILDTIDSTLQSKKICYRRSKGLIRIERFFRGMIRGVEVFDHLVDNLYALEDVDVIDERTIIGTVTLPDWIMGGMLTSRLWVSRLPNGNILTMRPLQNDDLGTSDRRYELVTGQDDERISLVQNELERLRYLAKLEHPIEYSVRGNLDNASNGEEKRDSPMLSSDSAVARQHRINTRRQKMRL